MSGHRDTIRSVSEGDRFHFYDPAMEKWIETEIDELDEYRSSYRSDTVIFDDKAIDDSDLRGTMPKSSFKDNVRNPEKKFHTGALEDCELDHRRGENQ